MPARRPSARLAKPKRTKTDELGAVLDLYRAAQRMAPKAHAEHVFAWIGERIGSERAVVVTALRGASWVDAHFHGVGDPQALMESHARVVHLDVVARRMLENPGTVHRIDREASELAGTKLAPLREHLRRYGCRHTLGVAIPRSEELMTTIMLIREHDEPFSDEDVIGLEALAPHLAEAFAINRAIHLEQGIGPESAALAAALLDADGRFVQTTRAFVHLFWPGAPPPTAFLPVDVLRKIRTGRGWPLPSGKHTLYAQPADGGGWLLRLRASGPVDRLTAREREIAGLFARGVSYKLIAREVAAAPATVRNHLQSAYEKLGVSDREQLADLLSKQ